MNTVTLTQLLEVSKEDLPSIYCDLDGVLVNFIKGADAAVDGSFVDTPKDERWHNLVQRNVESALKIEYPELTEQEINEIINVWSIFWPKNLIFSPP